MKKLLCVLSLFVMLSCSQMAEHSASADVADGSVAMEETVALKADPGNQNPLPEPLPERKLIRNGSMSFEVDDVTTTRQEVTAYATELGGYISSEKRGKNENDPRFEQIVRIPGDKFDEFVARVEKLAKEVHDHNFTSQDVTEEYVDLRSRLVAKRAIEARFKEIVKQAKTIKEILEVETEIGIVRRDIEQIEGKLKFLAGKTAYSTITLTYYENRVIELPGTASKFAESFISGWDGLMILLVAMTRTWPFLIILGIFAWFVMRRKRKEPVQPA